MPRPSISILLLAALALLEQPAAPAKTLPLDRIRLPAGFAIETYASGVDNARSMALGERGTVFVGSRTARKVYALTDANKDHKVDRIHEIATGLNMPNGVAFRDGDLYVAEINRILRYDAIEARLEKPPAPAVVNDTLPEDRHHGWKFIAFGPDGLLYVPVGAPCNVCERDDPRYASIMRMKPDGTGLEVFASGVRNTVGFDWHPVTNELWFTDNGRDNLGDDVPGDELNVAPRRGLHFGFPYCHQGDVPDPEFGKKRQCGEFQKPAQVLGPHVAAIGMRFYRGRMFPSEYRNQIFIAEHGSWNRSEPLGYRVMLAKLEGNAAVNYTPFAEGWLRGAARRMPQRNMTIGDAWGRPADVLELPDGSLLVSDDEASAIYRITYSARK